MLPKTLQKLLRFRARKPGPDLERFGRDVRKVMSARMWLAITGNLNAVEASRMVLEKQVAAVRAPCVFTPLRESRIREPRVLRYL
jgi:hypothetical protein